MAEESKSTVTIAAISAVSAIIVAVVTTYGTISVSKPEAQKVKAELQAVDLKKIANLPIGTIVPSMLPPGLFAKAVGDPSVFDPETSKWVLADGEEEVTNSRYGTLLGHTRFTPDLRGMFLRGVNEGRKDGHEDPDTRGPGDYQHDALQKHGHETSAKSLEWGSKEAQDLGYTTKGEAHAPAATVTAPTEANVAGETRPRNVAVYFYIKIN